MRHRLDLTLMEPGDVSALRRFAAVLENEHRIFPEAVARWVRGIADRLESIDPPGHEIQLPGDVYRTERKLSVEDEANIRRAFKAGQHEHPRPIHGR